MRRLLTLLLLLVGCSEEKASLIYVQPSGGVVSSEDGRFELIILSAPPEGLHVSVHQDDPQIEGLITRTYRVEPALTFLEPAFVRIYVEQENPSDQLFLAEVTAGRFDLLESTHEAEAGFVQIEVSRLSSTDLGVVAVPYEPCAGMTCGEGCSPCNPADPTCDLSSTAFCTADGACEQAAVPVCELGSIPGWDAAPGLGRTFVLRNLQVDTGPGLFNVDGRCEGPDACTDNVLRELGIQMNDQIRQGLLGGELLIGLEIVGASEGLATLKLYAVRDRDVPFFPANNFMIPPGHESCCEFDIHPQSLEDGQPRARLPVRISGNTVRSAAVGSFILPLAAGIPPYSEVHIERALFSLELPTVLGEAESGMMAGAWSIPALEDVCNPFCGGSSPLCTYPEATLLDLFQALSRIHVDVDLDGDGVEVILDEDGDRIPDTCFDGCGADACVVHPTQFGNPRSCVGDQRMADGYSIQTNLELVPADF